jgi:TPR repeat protein
MPISAYRRAVAVLGLLLLPLALSLSLSVALPRPALAQILETDRLNVARDAYAAKNYDKAFYTWLDLCQSGNRGSCYNLGLMYANGTGAPQDYVEAYKWLHLAAEAGLSEAIAARARLASSMSARDIKLAMDRAAEWKTDNGIR